MTSIEFLGHLPPRTAAGKKAEELDTLLKAGFRVPPGFILPPTATLNEITDAELETALSKIGGFPVAVRSSAGLEDLDGASFAGQYDSYLNVASLGELKEKIQACRGSAANERALAYLKEKGLSDQNVKMAVLIQKMVPAVVAGVAFSIHPLTGVEDHSLVECCLGLGEQLVSGHVNPSQYVLENRSGAVVEEILGSQNAKLSADLCRTLTTEILKIQQKKGRPQDIEWAVDERGLLWILQARPITRIQWRTNIEEFTNADFKDGGVSARVCTPLMFSLYRNALQISMPAYMKTIRLLPAGGEKDTYIATYYGRVYWNASAVKRAMMNVPGFSEKDFDADLGIQKNYGPQGPAVVPLSAGKILAAIPVLIALKKSYKNQLAKTDAYGSRFLRDDQSWRARLRDVDALSDEEFFEALENVARFQHRTECDYFTTIYGNSNYQSDFKAFLKKVEKATGREISTLRLFGGLQNVSHLKSQKDLVALFRVAREHGLESTAWQTALDRFISRNDFHGDAELDLSVPRWGETPERIREIVDGLLKSGIEPKDPDESSKEQHRLHQSEVSSLQASIKALGPRAFFMRSTFDRMRIVSRRFLSAREEMREYSTRAYYLTRLYVLEAGRRLSRARIIENPSDVLMLHIEELISAGRKTLTPTALKEIILYRQQLYDGFRDLTPPDELGKNVVQRELESYIDRSGSSLTLKGLGCSPGQVEGLVRVVMTLDEARSLQKGEILVTKFTDPGWTPVLGMVQGVITEVGGLLSHAAVIGREYGIPAVLNLPGATRILKTGQRIRVDGATGDVQVLSAP